MSLLGKILALLNVFAVVGTLALMAMNYAQRQRWEYAVFRQDLMIHGLPLDDKETDEQHQLLMKDKISDKTRQDMFKQAQPSTPVATQKEELDRVQNLLQSQYQSAGPKWKQMAALARILTPMADTIEQRQRLMAYQTHLRDENTLADVKKRLAEADAAAAKRAKDAQPKPYEEAFHDVLGATFTAPLGPLAEAFLAAKKADANATVEKAFEQSLDTQFAQLQEQFAQMFRNAFNGGEGAKPGAPSQQKRTIARLLFNMVEVMAPAQPAQGAAANLDLASNPAYKRLFIVVGVQAAVEAVNEQAGILHHLAVEAEAERPRERSLFAVEHHKAVDLVLDKKAEVDQHKLLLDLKKKELATHEDALRKRRQDVERYQQELAAVRQETAGHLAQLRELSKKLLAERLKLRDNADSLQTLEHDIRALEQGR